MLLTVSKKTNHFLKNDQKVVSIFTFLTKESSKQLA